MSGENNSKLTQPWVSQWIDVKENLPEERINPVTQDFYWYLCTFRLGTVKDVRAYKFGNGHWWHGGQIMDDYITAWIPRPEPYSR